jgi:hypothetical protein
MLVIDYWKLEGITMDIDNLHEIGTVAASTMPEWFRQLIEKAGPITVVGKGYQCGTLLLYSSTHFPDEGEEYPELGETIEHKDTGTQMRVVGIVPIIRTVVCRTQRCEGSISIWNIRRLVGG